MPIDPLTKGKVRSGRDDGRPTEDDRAREREGEQGMPGRGTPRLRQNATADTVIVGSGIAGLSTAYELSGQGQKVIVLDRGKIGCGMTARTTAHLTANNDDGFRAMIERRGVDLAKQFYQSQSA